MISSLFTLALLISFLWLRFGSIQVAGFESCLGRSSLILVYLCNRQTASYECLWLFVFRTEVPKNLPTILRTKENRREFYGFSLKFVTLRRNTRFNQ